MSIEKDSELLEIGSRLVQAHGSELTRAACLIHLTAALFIAGGLSESKSGAELLEMQRECVGAWLEKQGLGTSCLDAAMTGFQRSAATARYLDSLPA